MTKRTPQNKLTIYRRHAGSCTVQDSRKLDDPNCQCALWVHGKLNGENIRQSLDTRNLGTAIMKRDQMLNGRPPEPTPGNIHVVGQTPNGDITLEHAAQEFSSSKTELASRSKILYVRAIGHFRTWAGAQGFVLLKQVDTPQIKQYFNEFAPHWKRNTAQGRLVHLRVFFNYCCRKRRWIAFPPTADSDLNFRRGTQSSTRTPFTPEEVTRILAAIERLPEDVRDRSRALILLLLYSGMRISDATFIERNCLNERNVLDYWVIKTRKQIGLPIELQPPAVEALKALRASRVYFFQADREDNYQEARQALRDGQEFGAFIPDYDARVRETTALVLKVLEMAGIEGACHRFRDTFAINMLVQGADIFTVSQALGHSDVKITQAHYLKLIPGYRERMSQSTRVLAYQFPLAG